MRDLAVVAPILMLVAWPVSAVEADDGFCVRSNYLLGLQLEPPWGPSELNLRHAVASVSPGPVRVLRKLVGGPGTATLQVEHRLSSLADIEGVAAGLSQPGIVSALERLGPVRAAWHEVFVEILQGAPPYENAAVVRLSFACHPANVAAVVETLVTVNALFEELGLPRGRVLVGLLCGTDSPDVLLEGEFKDLAALQQAMGVLRGSQRYARLLGSIGAVDVAEEVLLAIDKPRGRVQGPGAQSP